MKKGTEHVRQIDDLGRIVLPADMRNEHNINPFDKLLITSTEEGILIKRYED